MKPDQFIPSSIVLSQLKPHMLTLIKVRFSCIWFINHGFCYLYIQNNHKPFTHHTYLFYNCIFMDLIALTDSNAKNIFACYYLFSFHHLMLLLLLVIKPVTDICHACNNDFLTLMFWVFVCLLLLPVANKQMHSLSVFYALSLEHTLLTQGRRNGDSLNNIKYNTIYMID